MALSLIREVPALDGKRVTVMGLGLFGGGLGVTRFLVRSGARVTVTDSKSQAELRESVEALRSVPVIFRLGGHDERDFRQADLVIVNPAVPESHPLLALAPALETEMNLFFKLCPAGSILGVTGSNGKTTTTTLIGEILKAQPTRTWVGGNIGLSLLESLDQMAPDHLVVLELSSFQLENLGVLKKSPSVGVVLNLSPNHLDRHGSMENYAEAKRQMVAHQKGTDAKVLNWDDPRVRGFASGAGSRSRFFSLKEPCPDGAWGREHRIEFSVPGLGPAIDVSHRKLPGAFNLANMAAAALATSPGILDWAGAGTPGWRTACERVFNAFPGVEHRLEFVAEKGGVKFYNDSKSTDAEATIAALETLPGPFLLILGGFDKRTPWDTLARIVASKPVRAVVLMGQTAPAIEAALRGSQRVPEIIRVSSIEEAVGVPAHPGETVLLSPACASWDMFRNFTERGQRFKALVAALPEG